MDPNSPHQQPNVQSLAEGWLGTTGTESRRDLSHSFGRPAVPGYRIIRELGRGGMGVVFEARQENPNRLVALKVIRSDRYVDEQAVRLFQREAQALARLKHPCIAAIHESGRTEDGQHYFSMELVRGQPLLRYLCQTQLSLRERLELFMRICDAVNYAHQQGVMHRDLKPSNILIVEEASAGASKHSGVISQASPKILDFGLARITDSDVAATTVVTAIGQIVGTLQYMSPEQARGNPDEIDIRSDVYSLGVILYEMLTGALPYELGKAMVHEAARIICESPPRRPSSIKPDSSGRAPAGAPGAGTSVVRFGESPITGDLETIVLKALEKEKARRYQAAISLAADIQRFLSDQPISARPPSAMYQFSKFARRNKAVVGGLAAVFLILTASTIIITALFRSSENRRRQAEAQTALLKQAEAKERSARNEAEQETQRARQSEQVAAEQRQLAEERQAETEKVADFQSRMLAGVDVEEMGAGLLRLLQAEVESGLRNQLVGSPANRRKLTDKEIRDGLIDFDRAVRPGAAVAAAKQLISEYILRRASRELEAKFHGNERSAAPIYDSLGRMYLLLGSYDSAVQHFNAALTKRTHLHGAESWEVASIQHSLATAHHRKGDFADAEPLLRKAMETRRRLRPGSRELGATYDLLADVLQARGKDGEAEVMWRTALDTFLEATYPRDAHVASVLTKLGGLLTRKGAFSEAEELHQKALNIRRSLSGGSNRLDVAETLTSLGVVLQAMGRNAEAKHRFEEAIEITSNCCGEDDLKVATGRLRLAFLRLADRDYDAAKQMVLKARSSCPSLWDGDHRHSQEARIGLARALVGLGSFSDAESVLRQAAQRCDLMRMNQDNLQRMTYDALVALYDAWHAAESGKGYDQKAAEWREKLAKWRGTTQPAKTSQPQP